MSKSVRKFDLGVASTLHWNAPAQKAASPVNPNESNPDTTDTMQQDPAVDTLKVPTPYFDIMHPSRQGKPKQPGRVEAQSPNPEGIGPISR